ncbi:hypothetical protein QUF80_02500 [Desulfococcaceae bacterium HSG8]|nr:hypothetical protein [Desulfococcaceae bacterium HSG8]
MTGRESTRIETSRNARLGLTNPKHFRLIYQSFDRIGSPRMLTWQIPSISPVGLTNPTVTWLGFVNPSHLAR